MGIEPTTRSLGSGVVPQHYQWPFQLFNPANGLLNFSKLERGPDLLLRTVVTLRFGLNLEPSPS